ncbi:MAG: hypothetical protein LBS54_04155 [Dysgonamonadaceae bacterium]|jgi:hypothetical protein|nr:hypothetical protein [Dysgonamonadaceae bacterium]
MAQEKIIFAKPSSAGFCFIVTFEQGGKMYLDDVFFADGAEELNKLIAENAANVEQIRYDCSIFMQDGKNLRALLPDVDIRLYAPKKKLIERVTAQSEWLNENLITDPDYEQVEYVRFIGMTENYMIGDKQNPTISVDVLSDAANYYRRRLLYDIKS